jgi:PAS domain S-box-containing protein
MRTIACVQALSAGPSRATSALVDREIERDSVPGDAAAEVDAALRSILEGTASKTGTEFFAALVENLARALGTTGAWVTEYVPEQDRLVALAFRLGDGWLENYSHPVTGTPCEVAIRERRLVHYPDNIIELYPNQHDMRAVGAVSYMGVPLFALDGTIIGHLAVMHRAPLPLGTRMLAVFQIFASRAAAELSRLRVERSLREREEKLARLVHSAMDAIVELDQGLRITQLNPAAEVMLGARSLEMLGTMLSEHMTPESGAELARHTAELDGRPLGSQSLWLTRGLSLRRKSGEAFSAEATLSRSEQGGATHYTLILRDQSDRLEAEHRIQSLSAEAEYLREEIGAVVRADAIVGESPALRQVLDDAALVAAADSSVLIYGETGTGKELFARAIHHASARKDKPLVKVNCAALPASLMESEFFGHERGAFTGATQRRVGRFVLADRGTLFLDEIGELPLDLQAKLLRVLQEGELESVGSSKTIKVDVRIVAATNRDLGAEIRAGRFREDLYYRLSVFPLRLPPLRERPEDIGRLASAFVERIGRRLGRSFLPLTPDCVRRLEAYAWPGNVRELENVIERAAVISRDARLNLDRALPELASESAARAAPSAPEPLADNRVLRAREIEALERDNVLRALAAAKGRVAGAGGAAELLDIPASTLASRMKSLGIKRSP